MAKYKALKRGFCECIREVGEVFEYGGQADEYWMEPLDKKAEAKVVEKPEAAKPEVKTTAVKPSK